MFARKTRIALAGFAAAAALGGTALASAGTALADTTPAVAGTVDLKEGPGEFAHATLYSDGSASVLVHQPGGATVTESDQWLTFNPGDGSTAIVVRSFPAADGAKTFATVPDASGTYVPGDAGVSLPSEATSALVNLNMAA